jgi:putative AbiEi antitoxin of type IV toxin-antitoxin system
VKTRRRIEITVETDERFIVKGLGGSLPAWCPECAGQVITPQEAVAVAGISSRAIHRLVESGAVHFTETPEGVLLICLSSLLRGAV